LKLLEKESSKVIDIVKRDSLYSCCFTKGYFRLMKGTGSLLKIGELDGEEMIGWYKKLRYFSP